MTEWIIDMGKSSMLPFIDTIDAQRWTIMSKVIVIKALEDAVSVLFASPNDNPNPAPERLDKGEVLVLSAPDKGDNIRVRGLAEVYTPDYLVNSESSLLIGGRTEENEKNE